MISREQIKAARAMLDWSQTVLAEKCGEVSVPTIKLLENGRVNSGENTLNAIRRTFEKYGIEFLPQNGVRFRDDLIKIIERTKADENIYLKLLDDMYYTVRDTKTEILHSFIDNSLSPSYVVDRELLIRKTGVKTRNLVRHGDHYLLYPLDEYRWLPKGYYINNPISVYGDKFAILVQNEPVGEHQSYIEKIIIIKNQDIANVKRMEFEMLWSIGIAPQSTIAEKTYA